MIIAYLSVNTNKQYLETQREEINRFASAKGLHIDKWVSEVTRDRHQPGERYLEQLLNRMKEGDILIISDISRLSFSLADLMPILSRFLKLKITLYSIEDRYVFDSSLNAEVMCRAFALLGEIDRTLVSTRTKDALAARRSAGVKLGRPAGSNSKQELLNANKQEIMQMLERGESVTKICAYFGVTKDTYYKFKHSYNL